MLKKITKSLASIFHRLRNGPCIEDDDDDDLSTCTDLRIITDPQTPEVFEDKILIVSGKTAKWLVSTYMKVAGEECLWQCVHTETRPIALA